MEDRIDILCEVLEDLPNMRHAIPVTIPEQKNQDVTKMHIPELQHETTKIIERIRVEVQYHYYVEVLILG